MEREEGKEEAKGGMEADEEGSVREKGRDRQADIPTHTQTDTQTEGVDQDSCISIPLFISFMFTSSFFHVRLVHFDKIREYVNNFPMYDS